MDRSVSWLAKWFDSQPEDIKEEIMKIQRNHKQERIDAWDEGFKGGKQFQIRAIYGEIMPISNPYRGT